MIYQKLIFILILFTLIGCSSNLEANSPSISAQPVTKEPVYLLMHAHIEGDMAANEGNTPDNTIFYQTLPLPSIGAIPIGPTYSIDIAGTELLYEATRNLRDSLGQPPVWFWNPTGEFWQTEADKTYGGKLFARYDFLSLGHEFGIQSHAIYYSGQYFYWYKSPHTKEGVEHKFKDLHCFAEQAYHNSQKVNGGLTYTGGWKLEKNALGDKETEYIIDHTAYSLGYRIAFEDHDAHVEDEPAEIKNSRCSYFVYRADYGDGVSIIKIDMNGSLNADSPGNTPRSETPQEAIKRLEETLSARANDPDRNKVYYFGFCVHPNSIWADYNITKGGEGSHGEGKGLSTFLPLLKDKIEGGAPIVFITPSELARIFESKNLQKN